MKKCITFSFCIIMTALAIVACQNEENEISEANPENLSKMSNLTKLLQRVSTVETDIDDAVDSTSCIKIKFPYTVFVHDYQQEDFSFEFSQPVTNEQELQDMVRIIQNLNDAQDYFTPVFPITIIHQNGEEELIEDQQEMNAVKAQCTPTDPVGGSIGCVTINYPVTIFGYDSDFQLANTYTIVNDAQLFMFILNLQATAYYAIDYPLSISYLNGQNITVSNNAELQDAINSGIITCSPPIDPCPNPRILTDSLIVYIPFGNELKNLTGRGTPTITGNYHYVTDRGGNPNGAFSFDDGANNNENSIIIPLNSTNDIMKYNNFTVSVWIKRQDNSGTNLFEEIAANMGFVLLMGHSELPGVMSPMLITTNNSDWPIYDTSWINQNLGSDIGNWHQIVVSYDSSINLMRLYRNGVLRNAIAPTSMPTSIPSLIFGNAYKGFMDDIRVYNKALTDAEVHTLYDLDGDIYNCMD